MKERGREGAKGKEKMEARKKERECEGWEEELEHRLKKQVSFQLLKKQEEKHGNQKVR